jgi:hypothetical protein
MLHIQSSIEIATSLGEAFRLLGDAERKARLNPEIEVLRVSQVTDGPLGVGTRIYYSLQTPAGTRSFHCEVVAFESNRLIEWVSDTQPLFRVRQSLEPTSRGCRLVHDEWLAIEVVPPRKQRQWSLLDVAQAFEKVAGFDVPAAGAGGAAGELVDAMQRSLSVWLGNIKSSLEAARPETPIDFTAPSTVAF